jgi:hypothetical protein
MESLLRDPIWQFVGVVMAVAGVAVAVWAALRRVNGLAYEYRSDRLAIIDAAATDQIKVLYRGQEVSNVRLARLRFVNVGRQPIRPTDFEEAISVRFPPECTVLSGEIERARPEYLRVTFHLEGAEGSYTGIGVEPMLLNPKDSFTLKLVLSGKDVVPSVTARIANISVIETLAPNRETPVAKVLRALASTFLIVGGLLLGVQVPMAIEILGFLLVGIVSLVLGALLSVRMDRMFDRDRL